MSEELLTIEEGFIDEPDQMGELSEEDLKLEEEEN